jgi:hypothetical protein
MEPSASIFKLLFYPENIDWSLLRNVADFIILWRHTQEDSNLHMWCIDPLLNGDSVNSDRCYATTK